jgi:hypothetical protein
LQKATAASASPAADQRSSNQPLCTPHQGPTSDFEPPSSRLHVCVISGESGDERLWQHFDVCRRIPPPRLLRIDFDTCEAGPSACTARRSVGASVSYLALPFGRHQACCQPLSKRATGAVRVTRKRCCRWTRSSDPERADRQVGAALMTHACRLSAGQHHPPTERGRGDLLLSAVLQLLL